MPNRKTLIALLILLMLGPFSQSSQRPAERNREQSATAIRIADDLLPAMPGGIEIVEAYRIDSPHFGFGGWSGMAMTEPRQFVMASDTGWTMRFGLTDNGSIDGFEIKRLPGIATVTGTGKRNRDLEGLERTAQGELYAVFEGNHSISRYDAELQNELATTRPEAMEGWPSNRGGETLIALLDGRWMVIAERAPPPHGLNRVLLFSGDPSLDGTPVEERTYDAGDKGAVTDGTVLPDGRIVLLHRNFALPFNFTATIAIADPIGDDAEVSDDATPWQSRTLATFDERLAENYEAIAVDPDPDCDCVWILSDDNLSNWQRTLLLRVRISDAGPDAAQGE